MEKEYYISVGGWTDVCQEVSTLINNGYQLAGNLVILKHEDDSDGSKYVLYYQPLIGPKAARKQ